MGEKSAQNLLDEIEASKKDGLARLIYALGMRFVGERTGQLLAEHFGDLDAIAHAIGGAAHGSGRSGAESRGQHRGVFFGESKSGFD